MKILMASLAFSLAMGLSVAGLPAAAQATAPEAQPLGGLNVPDVSLIDQDGRPVHFYSDLVKDKVVAMNFVFTTCTTICPPMGATFAKLQKLLAGKDVHLISVSVDPATDTPERLKAWAGKFGAAPGWTLVTGDRNEVNRLLKALGVFTAGVADHSPLVLLGNDAAHRWTRAYGLAPPAKLAELIGQMAPPAVAKKESR
ncbi:MAG TPA: SCO family protein [Thermoanaerobaculia bacterium]|nr:SCO family protein [Thermoanaerobaculia bacterium]